MLRMVLLLCLLVAGLWAGAMRFDDRSCENLAFQNDTFVVVELKSLKRVFKLKNKVITEEKAKSLIKEAYENLGEKEYPEIRFKSDAVFEIAESICGKLKRGDKLKVSWVDLYDSMCPHHKSSLKRGDKAVFYRHSEFKSSKWKSFSVKNLKPVRVAIERLQKERVLEAKLLAVKHAKMFVVLKTKLSKWQKSKATAKEQMSLFKKMMDYLEDDYGFEKEKKAYVIDLFVEELIKAKMSLELQEEMVLEVDDYYALSEGKNKEILDKLKGKLKPEIFAYFED